MSFAELIGDQQASIFETLGEDAAWEGVAGTVRVRWREEDEMPRFGDSRAIVRGNQIRVRRSEVPAPAADQVVELATGERYQLIAEPVLDRKGVWICEVEELP